MKLGICCLAGLKAAVVPGVTPVPVQGTPLQGPVVVSGAPGPPGRAVVTVSEPKTPAGVRTAVCGCSADTDHALPHGPAIV